MSVFRVKRRASSESGVATARSTTTLRRAIGVDRTEPLVSCSDKALSWCHASRARIAASAAEMAVSPSIAPWALCTRSLVLPVHPGGAVAVEPLYAAGNAWCGLLGHEMKAVDNQGERGEKPAEAGDGVTEDPSVCANGRGNR